MDWFWQAVLLLVFTVPVIVLFAYAAWDVIRRRDAKAIVKAAWLVVFCIVPIVGPLVYLVVRPPGTTATQRALAEGTTTEAEQLQSMAADEAYRQAQAKGVATEQGSVREQRGSQLL